MAWLNGLTCILVLYDVMCQYFVHLREHFSQSPHLTFPSGLRIQRGIGQFHVHGHIPQCFARFSSNFISGAGMQDGEIIETLWNQTNAIADSTRGMSSAHHREVIDDHMNDSNWKKLTKMSTCCARRIISWANCERCAQRPSSYPSGNGQAESTNLPWRLSTTFVKPQIQNSAASGRLQPMPPITYVMAMQPQWTFMTYQRSRVSASSFNTGPYDNIICI